MHYLTEVIREKKNERFFESRHAEGYFDRVWGVHPIADVGGKNSREIEEIDFSPRQKVIEGVSAAYRMPRFLFPLNFLLSQAKLVLMLRRIVKRERIDLLSATDPFYLGLLGVILKKMTGRPLAVHVYANFDELYEATGALAMPRLIPFRWLEKFIGSSVLKRADIVIAPNRNNLGWALNNGARGLTAVISNAKFVEDRHLSPPEERTGGEETLARHGLPQGRPLLLCLGRLLELKHPHDAVRAMAKVIEKRPDAIGLLAGRGPMQEELERLIASLGMEGKIRLLGFVNQEDLSHIIPRSITVSPLTGMALIECGLGASPIVAYDRDWQADFVCDGERGFVVPFGDIDGMAERTLRLLDDPALARRFGAAIRAHARELADRERIRRGEWEAFDRVLGPRGTTAD